MTNHDSFMRRCLELAGNGTGQVTPNPLVGSVIVCEGRIIGEGYHALYGGPHAEVNAIRSVRHTELLRKSTLYVSLEPCAHHGKTPPCSDLIIGKGIPHVVIGSSDPYSEVSGRGIQRLLQAGIKVETGVLEQECRWLNRRFFTFHEIKRPYIILKWAQTLDGFIAPGNQPDRPVWISGPMARLMVHRLRTGEAAILAGTNTVLKDNPCLTARDWSGQSPLRVIIDQNGKIPPHFNIFKEDAPTLFFTGEGYGPSGNAESCQINFNKDVPAQILQELYRRNILSVIVEGGAVTLQHFMDAGLWDEALVFTGPEFFFSGIKAPRIQGICAGQESIEQTVLSLIVNPANPYYF